MDKPVKSFDDLKALSEWFDSEVFRAVADDTLYIHDTGENCWYRYRWTQGEREIKFVERVEGALPIVAQVYP